MTAYTFLTLDGPTPESDMFPGLKSGFSATLWGDSCDVLVSGAFTVVDSAPRLHADPGAVPAEAGFGSLKRFCFEELFRKGELFEDKAASSWESEILSRRISNLLAFILLGTIRLVWILLCTVQAH